MPQKNILCKRNRLEELAPITPTPVAEVAGNAKITYTISENTKLEDLLKHDVADTVVIGEVVFNRTENGFFSLNAVYEASGRPENKSPRDFFRTEDGKPYLTDPALQAEILVQKGASGGTWGSKKVVYQYASYLSKDFYHLVYDTFESVQVAQLTQVKEVAENLLHTGASTVKELALAYEQNELKQLEVDARTRERDEYRKSLRDTTSPFAARLRDSASKAAVELRKDLGQLRGNLNSAAQLLGIVDSSLERLRKSLPKDSSKQFEELVYARGYLEKALNLLTED